MSGSWNRSSSRAAIGIAAVGLAWALSAPADAAERTLRFAHIFSPEHSIHKAAQHMAEVVREQTNGELEITILPSEQLGNERQIMEGLMFGSIEMGSVTNNIVQGFEPAAGVMALPYLIRSFDHAFAVEDGPIGAEIADRVLETTGVRTVGYNVTGFRMIATRDEPVQTLDAFEGLRIRVPESPVMVQTFQALGANPTPIPWGELYTAMQTNVVDACEAPPAALNDIKIFEVAKALSKTNHVYTGQFVLISETLWQDLSEREKAALLAGAQANTEMQRALAVESEAATLKQVEAEQGVTVYDVDTAPFQSAVEPVYEDFASQIGGMELIDSIRNM